MRCCFRASPLHPPCRLSGRPPSPHQAITTSRALAATGQPAARRAQTLTGATAVEARASRTYQEGVDILSTAANVAQATRTMAACAEAKVGRRTAGSDIFVLEQRTGLVVCACECLVSLFPLPSIVSICFEHPALQRSNSDQIRTTFFVHGPEKRPTAEDLSE